jgi:hypothetical protein
MSNRGLQILEGVIKMPFLVIILVVIIIYVFIKSGGEHIQQDWNKHRNNPSVMPFSGMLGKSSSGNLKGVFYTKFKRYFSFLMKPVQYVMKIIQTILHKLVGSVNLFRAILKPIRVMFKAVGEMFYNKLNTFAAMIAYFFAKIRDSLRRLAGVFQLTLFTLQAIQLTLKSVWDGPIGSVSRDFAYALSPIRSFFCLSGDTPIRLADQRFLPLKMLPIGCLLDSPTGPTKLLGIAKVNAKGVDLYQYGDCIMSGSHLVYHNNKWCRGENVARYYGNSIFDYLYCPLTENNTIVTTDGVVLRDYEEVSGDVINRKLLCHSLQHLNILRGWSENELGPISSSTQGISACSLINVSQGKRVPADQISIGTVLEDGDIVEGIIKFLPQDRLCYNISDNLKVTGRQILQIDRCWQEASRFVWDKENSGDEKFYGFLTHKGILRSGDICITDVCDGLTPLGLFRQEQIISKHINQPDS